MSRETNERDDDGGGVDAMLRDHFAAALDGHVGRSRRAFERHVAAMSTAASPVFDAPLRTRDRRGWVIAGLGAGLAASVAAIFVIPTLRVAPQPPVAAVSNREVGPGIAGHRGGSPLAAAPIPSVPATNVVSPFHFQKVDEVLSRHAEVEGLIVIDDHTPARIVRERAVERTRWVDERRGVRIETIVPREDVKLIHLETH